MYRIGMNKLCNEITALRLRKDISLIHKATIGCFDSNGADAKVPGKAALGRQMGSGRKTPR